MANEVLDRILKEKIVAVVRGVSSGQIIDLAQALEKGGVTCIEVTFDQSSEEKAKDTVKAIRRLKEEMGERILVGAGTVMTPAQVREAAQAGAEYMISPNTNDDVIRETKRLGKVSVPGAFTPSEAAHAYETGADIVKIFPAGNVGPSYIKALKAPLKHIPMMATGGITVENCAEFLKAGTDGLGVGGNLVSLKLIEEGKFDEITKTAKAYVQAVRGV